VGIVKAFLVVIKNDETACVLEELLRFEYNVILVGSGEEALTAFNTISVSVELRERHKTLTDRCTKLCSAMQSKLAILREQHAALRLQISLCNVDDDRLSNK
jgi:hypothetical protein